MGRERRRDRERREVRSGRERGRESDKLIKEAKEERTSLFLLRVVVQCTCGRVKY